MKILLGRYRLSLRLSQVIVPIEYSTLAAALQARGYIVPKMPRLPVGSGLSLEPLGVLAQQGDVTIDADIAHGIIGVDAASPKEAMTGFNQLTESLEKDLRIDLAKNTWFVENINELNIQGSQEALPTLKKFDAENELIRVTSKLLGEPTAFFGLRVGSAESTPIDADWFDFRVEPLLRNPRVYWVNMVYRNPKREKVLQLFEDLDSKIGRVISTIESSAKGIQERRIPTDSKRTRIVKTS